MRPLPRGEVLGVDAVLAWLPQRAPLLLVDRVVGFRASPDPALLAEYDVPADHPVLEGHFPGDPLWPGVYTIEGLAQTAQLLLARAGLGSGPPARGLLADVGVRLVSPVRPGDTLVYRADHGGSFGAGHRVAVEARVGRQIVAAGVIAVAAQAALPSVTGREP